MITIDDKGPWQQELRAEIERLAGLLDDMQRLAAGRFPDAGELAVAPVIVTPDLSVRPALCLVGLGVGHPGIGNKPLQTSPLEVLNFRGGWARTRSRLYRLDGYE